MMETESLSVVIVGGSAGLGKVIAYRYLKDGFRVVIISRNKPGFVDLNNAFSHYSEDLSSITAERAHELAYRITQNTGRPSYLVFCQRYRGAERSLAAELLVGVTATEMLVEALIPHFAEDGDRAIIAVTSVYADFVGSSQPSSYHIVKAGLNALIRYYAVKLGANGIRSNAIAPLTYLKDESKHVYLNNESTLAKYKRLVPLQRMPLAEECANVIRFLGSEQAAFVTGQVVYVDGGVSAIWPEELA